MAVTWAQRRSELRYDPNQPRVPAGQSGGGRWTDGGGVPVGYRRASSFDSDRELFVSEGEPGFAARAADGELIELFIDEEAVGFLREAVDPQLAVNVLNGVIDGYDMAPTPSPPEVRVVNDGRIPAPAAVNHSGSVYPSNAVLMNIHPDQHIQWGLTAAGADEVEAALVGIGMDAAEAAQAAAQYREWMMPAADKVGYARYIGTHEYGHVRAAVGEDDIALIDEVRPMTLGQNRDPRTDGVWGAMSTYARANAAEAHAEAFAEWAASGGQTTNRFALAYADIFGWGDDEERALAASAGMPDWDDIEFICDSPLDGPSYVLTDGSRLVGAIEQFHLQGQHDQKTHGNRHGRRPYEQAGDLLIQGPINGASVISAVARRSAKAEGPIAVADFMSPQERRMLEVSLGTYDDTRASVMTSVAIRPAVDSARQVGLDPRHHPNMPVGTLLQIHHVQQKIEAVKVDDYHGARSDAMKLDSIIDEFATMSEGTNGVGPDYDEALATLTYELENQFGVSPAAGFIGLLNGSWAESSQDHVSQAHQIAVANIRGHEFAQDGTPESMRWLHSHPEFPRGLTEAKNLYHEWQGAFDAAAFATYRRTQKMFPPGTGDVTLYRGVKSIDAVNTEYGDIAAEVNPLSSWTTNPDTALDFGGGAYVLEATVPIEAIYTSSAISGLGSLPEWEVIVTSDDILPARIVNRDPETDSPLDWEDTYDVIHGTYQPKKMAAAANTRVEDGTLIIPVDAISPDWIREVGRRTTGQFRFNPNQPRIPAGQTGGGRWTDGVGGRRVAPVSGETIKQSIESDLTMMALPDKVAAKVTKQFTDSLHATPDEARQHLIDMAESALAKGMPGRHWYQTAHDEVIAEADRLGIDPEVALAMTAALSPGTPWDENLRNAKAIMAAMADRDAPLDEAHIRNTNVWANRPDGSTGERNSDVRARADDTFMTLYERDPRVAAVYLAKKIGASVGYSYDNFFKATDLVVANDPAAIDGILNGAKVRSFYNNLARPQGVDGDVTVDIHMQRAMANNTGSTTPQQKFDRSTSIKKRSSSLTGSPSLNGAQLGAMPLMADVIREATAEFNARHNLDLLPHEFQAVVWVEQIDQYPPSRMTKILKGQEL